MPHRIDFTPLGLTALSPQGTSIKHAIEEAGIKLRSVCGNKGLCGKCRVRITAGTVSPPSPEEKKLFPEHELVHGYRLACQTRILSDLRVTLPSSSLIKDRLIQLATGEPDQPVDPPVKDYQLTLALHNTDAAQTTWERLRETLEHRHHKIVTAIDSIVLDHLPSRLSELKGSVRVSVCNQEVIDIRSPDKAPLGCAIDLGTTKLAGYLVDLETGKTLSAEGIENPQRSYGDDVMSRIAYTLERDGRKLAKVVVEGINELIKNLCPEPEQIVELTLAGNTAMHHLFLGLPVKQLGQAPYQPHTNKPLDLKAREMGLDTAPGAYLHILPPVAGFVGGDHVAMILATDIHRTEKTVLGLDIGTNTEIVLVHRGTMKSVSCASGPAFEGGHITHGMEASPGAIEKVTMDEGSVTVYTIDHLPPRGLCGSGILDTIAEFCRLHIIDSKGHLKGTHGSHQITAGTFILVPAEKTGTGSTIIISQQDIVEVQLAKAAIRTGIDTLIDEMGITGEGIEEIIVTGGFAHALNPVSGLTIGMFPPFKPEQFKVVTNAAGIGAKRCLISNEQRKAAAEIADHICHIELMTHPQFKTRFARAMYFPE